MTFHLLLTARLSVGDFVLYDHKGITKHDMLNVCRWHITCVCFVECTESIAVTLHNKLFVNTISKNLTFLLFLLIDYILTFGHLKWVFNVALQCFTAFHTVRNNCIK